MRPKFEPAWERREASQEEGGAGNSARQANWLASRSAMLRRVLRDFSDRHMSRARASLLAVGLTALAAWGDAITSAEATFTLCYVIPLAIAVWFVGRGAGYAIAALATAASVTLDVLVAAHPANWRFVAWNAGAEAGLYLVFVHVLWALRARVDSETTQRRAALDQLRHAERLTTIGKLASGIAHEIGTPLNVISGHAELIASGRLEPDEAKRSGRILLEQTDKVGRVIRQLLDFSRRGGERTHKLDLTALTAETVELLRPLARRVGVEIVFEGGSVDVALNGSEIQQVVTNLVTNAIQAMPSGGVLELQTCSEELVPRGVRRGTARRYAILTVRDQGTGITADVLGKIFDPFFTTKDVGQGTGLGLSVAYGIVTDHDGWISVDTRLGEGTTFCVYLPQLPDD